ncbi:phage tail protein [Chromobacterium amazonense]|uniref:Phage tail protein n=1 Tax=Chromobacterium amazonense TaxID=1382803 RepID=A0A2S9XA93_9NEIS|nr:baseplate J/gp47 family protein [Chromobacterium amazonense]PRP72658.1 phage tail protein [Chromobacterium amazonense]
MPLSTPDFASIRDALLRDLQNLRADAATAPDSDNFVRASATAGAVEGLYQHQSWIARQIFPDTADSAYLEQHARLRGIVRKPATAASGWLQINGAPGALVASGLQVRVGDQLYVAQPFDAQGKPAPDRLDANGQASLPIQASLPGSAGNQPANLPVELMQAPSGIASKAMLLTMTGATDEESDPALLDRLLELIRRPPAGGNQYDYRRWAMEIDGVSAAYVYPLRRGPGTVDVVITADGSLPSDKTLAKVQAHIEDLRPVTAKNCLVLAPTPRPVDIDVALDLGGMGADAFTPLLQQTLQAYFAGLAPGEQLVKSRIEAMISDLPGVQDRQLNAPAGNVKPVSDASKVEWLRLGKLTVRTLK